jgi:hypothetical protein
VRSIVFFIACGFLGVCLGLAGLHYLADFSPPHLEAGLLGVCTGSFLLGVCLGVIGNETQECPHVPKGPP